MFVIPPNKISHKLTYPTSTSVSAVSLEQVFSDVWGAYPVSVGEQSYYESFSDTIKNSLGCIC
jgi:hypothetical protein